MRSSNIASIFPTHPYMAKRLAYPHDISTRIMIKNCFALFILQWFSVFTLSAQSAHSAVSAQIPREVRAVWLTTLMGLDWPQHAATTPEQSRKQQRELCQLNEQLHAVGINTELIQAR